MPLSYKQIQRILKDYDFILSRSKGSHFRYEKNGYGLTVAHHKEYPPKTAKSMLTDISEITGEEYKNLIDEYKIKL